MVTKILTELKNPSIGSQIYDYINLAQEWINEMGYWHHLTSKVPYQFRFLGPTSTGTVSVVNGSTAVVGTGTAFTAAMVGQVIRLDDVNEHYFIASVASATSLALAVEYNGTTNATASYSISFVNYDLPSNVSIRKILSIVVQNPYLKLEWIDQRRRDEVSPDPVQETGQPWGYMDWGQNTVQPWPIPDRNYVVTIRFQKLPTLVSSSQTVIDYPSEMHFGIMKLAMAQGWKFMDDDQAMEVLEEGLEMIQNSFDRQKKNTDANITLQPFDWYLSEGARGLRLGRLIG